MSSGRRRPAPARPRLIGLPILDNLVGGLGMVQSLVLVPTRELALQVAGALKSYATGLQPVVLAVYGGQPYSRQIGRLKRGVDIVVGTPGRLLDLIQQHALDLSAVQTVILDEADEMLSMGFIEDIEAILAETPATAPDRPLLGYPAPAHPPPGGALPAQPLRRDHPARAAHRRSHRAALLPGQRRR